LRTSAVSYSNVTSRTNGAVDFVYTVALQTTVTLSVVDGIESAVKGTSKTIRASVTSTTGGKITFYANGKRIPGCISKTVSATIDCSWKPSGQTAYELFASFTPTTSTDIASSGKLSGVSASKRSSKR
jgi:hypothetical protein